MVGFTKGGDPDALGEFAQQSRPGGTSVAAAEIAGFCSLLWRQHPPAAQGVARAIDIGEKIRRNMRFGTGAGETVTDPVFGNWTYQRIYTGNARIPGVANIHAALKSQTLP